MTGSDLRSGQRAGVKRLNICFPKPDPGDVDALSLAGEEIAAERCDNPRYPNRGIGWILPSGSFIPNGLFYDDNGRVRGTHGHSLKEAIDRAGIARQSANRAWSLANHAGWIRVTADDFVLGRAGGKWLDIPTARELTAPQVDFITANYPEDTCWDRSSLRGGCCLAGRDLATLWGHLDKCPKVDH